MVVKQPVNILIWLFLVYIFLKKLKKLILLELLSTPHCMVMLKSGVSCLSNDLWSTDSSCRQHFNPTTDKFNFGLLSSLSQNYFNIY